MLWLELEWDRRGRLTVRPELEAIMMGAATWDYTVGMLELELRLQTHVARAKKLNECLRAW